jgi:seryl-tRNA synthetase
MANKISDEQLKSLQEQEGKRKAIANDVLVLDMQKHQLLHIMSEIQTEQNKIKDEIEKEHGKVNIDLANGSFEKIEDKKE